MADITLEIKKGSVLDEVNKQTAYVGAKITMSDGTNAYDKIYATSDDNAMLERFWKEAVAFTTGNLKLYLKSYIIGVATPFDPKPETVSTNDVLTITLTMPTRYDVAQTLSVNASLYSYFVNYMTARWMALTNKPEAEYYEKYASTSMNDILKKIFSKTKPVRPTT